MSGSGGAVRIMWGPGRAYPSTLANNQPIVIGKDTKVLDTDLLLLFDPAAEASYSCQAVNTKNHGAKLVLVQEDDGINTPTSHYCQLSELTAKVTSNHWLLVNRGEISYKAPAKGFAESYGPFVTRNLSPTTGDVRAPSLIKKLSKKNETS